MSGNLFDVNITHSLGVMQFDVRFASCAPWTVLFGPSGSGKSTVMRAIAGFAKPQEGRIRIRQEEIFNTSKRLFLPPHRRPVRAAMQGSILFPHRTVMQNMIYGLGKKKLKESLGLAEEIVHSFGLSMLREKFPHAISGGEARRVSVARVLISAATFDGPAPPLLLLDEPLTGLDVPAREKMIAALKQWTEHRKIPVLSVTHEVSEVFQLGAHVVKLADGKVVKEGPASMTLAAERDAILHQLDRSF